MEVLTDMFIHVGSGDVIHSDRIIGFFDYERMQESTDNRAFLKNFADGRYVEGVASEVAKSLILADSGIIYLSLVATGTLKKRVRSTLKRYPEK